MMKFLLSLMFLVPFCFLYNFWLLVSVMFILSFLFMMNYSFNYIYLNISYILGSDLLSYTLILLSFWICSMMLLASGKIYKNNNYYYLFNLMVLFLLISLFLVFSSLNLFVFYLFFEISLIPTLILILGWGYQPERIEAGMYLLFYTLLVSLPMMISIFFYYNNYSSMMLMYMNCQMNLLIYLCMNMVFFVKMPMFFIHLWLPKAHVEAPVSGSMILAGIMLKLGGYGLIRLMSLFIEIGLKINYIFIVISLIGGFIVSLICLRQSDMKSLIAYSSVAHMGLVLSGIMTMNIWGFWGSLAMMLAHGLCSSGLFCLANITYERTMSRSLYLNKGLINIMPNLSLWWFLLCSSNMAAPPSLNLLGEIVLINSLISFISFSMVLLMFLSFFSAAYSLFLFSYSQHGVLYSGLFSMYQGLSREYLLLFLHWFPLNLLILKGELWILFI
uniref:NADH-ubiquinone oxidoreductase chain 4 n=1 Tax=Acanthoscelides obtectus TaxID=200917 RepID=A0A343D0L2_ACAOB|nr:NADH dehydrogenase subunit 4 [Acanthoscelides obtectus]ARR75263.1 NADH dehydrogenase subunit 4 [Acanthoscelides obtectus]ATL15483.1 NADH dehydrogenase subunit 4 [Acanthoscelides obtectus]